MSLPPCPNGRCFIARFPWLNCGCRSCEPDLSRSDPLLARTSTKLTPVLSLFHNVLRLACESRMATHNRAVTGILRPETGTCRKTRAVSGVSDGRMCQESRPLLVPARRGRVGDCSFGATMTSCGTRQRPGVWPEVSIPYDVIARCFLLSDPLDIHRFATASPRRRNMQRQRGARHRNLMTVEAGKAAPAMIVGEETGAGLVHNPEPSEVFAQYVEVRQGVFVPPPERQESRPLLSRRETRNDAFLTFLPNAVVGVGFSHHVRTKSPRTQIRRNLQGTCPRVGLRSVG